MLFINEEEVRGQDPDPVRKVPNPTESGLVQLISSPEVAWRVGRLSTRQEGLVPSFPLGPDSTSIQGDILYRIMQWWGEITLGRKMKNYGGWWMIEMHNILYTPRSIIKVLNIHSKHFIQVCFGSRTVWNCFFCKLPEPAKNHRNNIKLQFLP